MNKTWVQFIVAVLLAIAITSGPYILVNGTPEMVAGVLTLLVGLAAIVVPILVGLIPYSLKYGKPDTFDWGDLGAAWLLGTSIAIPTMVITGSIWLVCSSTYHYILNLLGG